MSDRTSVDTPLSTNVFAVPDQGWRGLGVTASNSKRKAYTVLHNEFVLVTALVVLPGERSIRHTHETGELSLSFSDPTRPVVKWNPPGWLHGGTVTAPQNDLDERVRTAIDRLGENDPNLKALLEEILQREIDISSRLDDLVRPTPGLNVIVDCLFPPFKTTIDDPAYPEKTTIVGQWYD